MRNSIATEARLGDIFPLLLRVHDYQVKRHFNFASVSCFYFISQLTLHDGLGVAILSRIFATDGT